MMNNFRDNFPSNFSLKSIDPNFPLTNVLWAIFAVAIVIFAIATVTLIYHWRNYGMGSKRVAFAEVVYLVVSVLIIIVAIVSIIFARY